MYFYSVLKNCQPGNLPARIDFSPNKPLSTPDTTQLWYNYTKAFYHKFKMAHNNTFRMFFNLDRLRSVSDEMNQGSIGTCNEIQHKLMCSLYRRIFQSWNDLMVALLNSDIVIENVLFKHVFDAVMKWCTTLIYGPSVWSK